MFPVVVSVGGEAASETEVRDLGDIAISDEHVTSSQVAMNDLFTVVSA